MWAYLRSFRAFGGRFRREAPIGSYIADFAWLSARIVVEVDGASHDLPGRADHDRERDRFLASRGFQVLRFRDADVLANDPDVFGAIEAVVQPLLSYPSPSPSPQEGGELAASLPHAEPNP
jgi:very-short-patch-repair endonuclease